MLLGLKRAALRIPLVLVSLVLCCPSFLLGGSLLDLPPGSVPLPKTPHSEGPALGSLLCHCCLELLIILSIICVFYVKTNGTREHGHKRGETSNVCVFALCHTCSVSYARSVAPWCPHLVRPLSLAELPRIVGPQEFRAHIPCPHGYSWVSRTLMAQGATPSVQTRTCFKSGRMTMAFLGTTRDQGALSYPFFPYVTSLY